jgi:hypothetical protein
MPSWYLSCDDAPTLFVTALEVVAARQLEQTFVGFRTAVAEEKLGVRRALAQLARELDARLVVEQVRDMHQPAGLLADRAHQLGMAMPNRDNSDARAQVQVTLAFDVGETAAFTLAKHHGVRAIVT